eukprot:c1216_g1_i1.p1 GENE.c1216_g1_i1~~c1216_g1_i1.p1  ORF type:complete len:964 (-),score=198.23 c1216_g1_i1:80-2971(-)
MRLSRQDMMSVLLLVAATVLGAVGEHVEIGADGSQRASLVVERSYGEVGVIASPQDPVHSCESIVHGKMRFQVLTPQVIRMEFVGDGGSFNDQKTFVFTNRNVPCVPFEKTITNNRVKIQTEFISLEYTGDGQTEFSATNVQAQIQFFKDGEPTSVSWVPGKANGGRLFGTIRTLDRVSGAFSLDCDTLPLKSKHPHSPVGQHCTYGLASKDGWVVVDDSSSPLFDGNPEWEWVDQHNPNIPRQDWYLFGHGRDYKQTVKDFTLLAGPQPIPPRFSFGVFYSRWWPWADWETISIIREYEEYSVPLDVMVTDMDWHKTCYREQDQGYVDLAGQPACWTGWSWDRKYFPDPKAFMDWCHRHRIKNTLNLHLASGVQPWEDRFAEMAVAMGLDPAQPKTFVEWNVTDKKFSKLFHQIMLKPLEDEGVDFWWLDWQQGEGWFKDTFPSLTPTYYLNYVFFTQPLRWQGGDRPIVLHRWGGLGNHRYPVGFSGDVYPNWESLAYQPYMTRESANVLFGYWSHDIGGFMEPAADELYLRWIQYGVFSPIFRTHGTRLAENIKRMWHYKPEYFKAMRSAMQLRIRMLPYLYTAARIAFETGVSVCSPLYYDFPNIADAYEFKTQYMFGPDIMVAPVVSPANADTKMVTNMNVWVPPGEWIETVTGRVFKGPRVVKRAFSLNEIPTYARAGSIIVNRLLGRDEEKDYRGWLGRAEERYEGLEVNVYLPLDVETQSQDSTLLYEDHGNNVDYLNGHYTWKKFSYTLALNAIALTIHPTRGEFTGMAVQQYYRLILHGAVPPTQVLIRTSEADAFEPVEYGAWATFDPLVESDTWYYDGSKVAVVVNLFKWHAISDEIQVVLEFGKELPFKNKQREQTAGLVGKLARAKVAKHTLDSAYPETTPSDYEDVTYFAAMAGRLSYNPLNGNVHEEIASADAKFQKVRSTAASFKAFRRKPAQGLNLLANAHVQHL